MSSKYEAALKLCRGRKPRRRAYDLLVEADREGDARATYALATWFLHGSAFTKRDVRLAVKMLGKAAKANVKDANFDLAVLHERGTGVRKSARKAFRLYVRAALLGEEQSHYEVGRMYYLGKGTSKDRDLADAWLAKAETFGITK